MLNKSILIIDDDVLNQKVLEIQLKKEFKNIYKADDKDCAFKIMNENRIDLIICDLNLGNISGIDVLKELDINFNLIPVIILSGYKDENYIEESKILGCLDFLFKPINKDDLLKSIRNAFKGIKNKTDKNEKINENESIVDLESLKRIIGPHMDVVLECFSDFLKLIPVKMEEIKKFINDQKMSSLFKTLHSLNNSLKFLTFKKAANITSTLENMTANKDIPKIKKKFIKLKYEMDRVEKFINKFIEENK